MKKFNRVADKWLTHELFGLGEAEDMIDFLRLHIRKFRREMSEREKKSDKRRVEIPLPKVKKENDGDLLLSPIKKKRRT